MRDSSKGLWDCQRLQKICQRLLQTEAERPSFFFFTHHCFAHATANWVMLKFATWRTSLSKIEDWDWDWKRLKQTVNQSRVWFLQREEGKREKWKQLLVQSVVVLFCCCEICQEIEKRFARTVFCTSRLGSVFAILFFFSSLLNENSVSLPYFSYQSLFTYRRLWWFVKFHFWWCGKPPRTDHQRFNSSGASAFKVMSKATSVKASSKSWFF